MYAQFTRSRLWQALLGLTLLTTVPLHAASFAYEGQLDDRGAPANGRYDIQLAVYRDAELGATLAAPVVFNAVEVREGRFRLDFDAKINDGESAWVELAVRDVGAGGFSVIPGRTKATQAPAAIGACWSTVGDSGSNPATHFLGTTDAQPLVLRTGNVRSLRIEPSAELFAGTPITANVIAGSSANTVTAGVRGATIAGGGLPSGASDPNFINEAPNRVTDAFGSIGGGYNNQAGDATGNLLDRAFATVGGGSSNSALGYAATVTGGNDNVAADRRGAVGGGSFNTAAGVAGSIGGGYTNYAGDSAVVGGGSENAAQGSFSSISGGELNCAGGDYSWASGRRAKVRASTPRGNGCIGVVTSGDTNGDEGSFVWADAQDADFVSNGPNQFLARAQGGVAFNGVPSDPRFEFSVFGNTPDNGFVEVELTPNRALNGLSGERIEIGVGPGGAGMNDASFRIAHRNDQLVLNYFERLLLNGDGSVVIRSSTSVASSGVQMAPGAGSWSSLSDRQLKTALRTIDTRALLDRLLAIPVQEWSYIAQGADVRHIGPMAQDFKAAFSVGENDTTISTVDADGVALAAIQGLNQKLEAENAALRANDQAMQAELAELRTLIETQGTGNR